MKKWFFPFIIAVSAFAFLPGCGGQGDNPVGVPSGGELTTTPGQGGGTSLVFSLPRPIVYSHGSVLGAGGQASVTFTLRMVNVGNAASPVSILSKTVSSVDGAASATFSQIPALPAIGEVCIIGGNINGTTEFNGATDLVEGVENILDLAASGSKELPDMLANVGRTVIASSTLFTLASTTFFADIQQAIEGMATSSASAYDEALALFEERRALDTWGPFFPDGLVNSSGAPINLTTLNSKIVGLYFSASWCSPCREFTPSLVTFRNEHAAEFEVVLIPNDSTQADQYKYMTDYQMLWPTIPFDSSAKGNLMTKYGVVGIPTLIILSPNGKLITSTGRTDVTYQPTTCLEAWKATAANL